MNETVLELSAGGRGQFRSTSHMVRSGSLRRSQRAVRRASAPASACTPAATTIRAAELASRPLRAQTAARSKRSAAKWPQPMPINVKCLSGSNGKAVGGLGQIAFLLSRSLCRATLQGRRWSGPVSEANDRHSKCLRQIRELHGASLLHCRSLGKFYRSSSRSGMCCHRYCGKSVPRLSPPAG